MVVPFARARRLAAALAAVLVLVAAGSVAPARSGSSALLPHEPAAASAFLAAYARGDEAAAEQLASPLYRAEWARRRVPAGERCAVCARPTGDPTDAPGVLAFGYVGGLPLSGGFAELLYSGRTIRADGRTTLSVWRADTDADGRVIWLELVWLFSDDVSTLVPAVPTAATLDLPPPVAVLRPSLLFGIRAARGSEGYYAVGPRAGGRPMPARFVGVDADGELRPGAWSYGEPIATDAHGPYGAPDAAPTDLAPQLAVLRGAYLRALPDVG